MVALAKDLEKQNHAFQIQKLHCVRVSRFRLSQAVNGRDKI